jgi:hypothetical protein
MPCQRTASTVSPKFTRARPDRHRSVGGDTTRYLAGLPWSLFADARPAGAVTCRLQPRTFGGWSPAAQPCQRRAIRGTRPTGVARAEEEVTDAAAGWATAPFLVGVQDMMRWQHAQRVDLFHRVQHGWHSADNPLFFPAYAGGCTMVRV